MKKVLSERDLRLIKLRAEKNLDQTKPPYQDIVAAVDCALQLIKENSLLREKIFDIEQSVSEEDRILNIIDAKLDAAMLSNDKKDFLEINKSINNDVWTIIIQKKFGQTPQQLLRQSEIRRSKAAKKIVNLHKENINLNNSINLLRADIKVLSAMKMDSPEDLLKTKEELKRLRALIDEKVKRYNSHIYRHVSPNLHNSFMDSLREAWSRVSVIESRAVKAESELFHLKESARKKKSPLSLIYDRRKRKEGKLINRTALRRL